MSFKKRKDPNGGKIIIQKNYNNECKWLNKNLIKEYNNSQVIIINNDKNIYEKHINKIKENNIIPIII